MAGSQHSGATFVRLLHTISKTRVENEDPTKQYDFDWDSAEKYNATELKNYDLLRSYLGFSVATFKQLKQGNYPLHRACSKELARKHFWPFDSETLAICQHPDVLPRWDALPKHNVQATRRSFFLTWFSPLLSRYGKAFNIPSTSECFQDLIYHVILRQLTNVRNNNRQKTTAKLRTQSLAMPHRSDPSSSTVPTAPSPIWQTLVNNDFGYQIDESESPFPPSIGPSFDLPNGNHEPPNEPLQPASTSMSSEDDFLFCFEYHNQDRFLLRLRDLCLLDDSPSLAKLDLQFLYRSIESFFSITDLVLTLRVNGYLNGQRVNIGCPFHMLAFYAHRVDPALVVFMVSVDNPVNGTPSVGNYGPIRSNGPAAPLGTNPGNASFGVPGGPITINNFQ